jgi:hypothetical protein
MLARNLQWRESLPVAEVFGGLGHGHEQQIAGERVLGLGRTVEGGVAIPRHQMADEEITNNTIPYNAILYYTTHRTKNTRQSRIKQFNTRIMALYLVMAVSMFG